MSRSRQITASFIPTRISLQSPPTQAKPTKAESLVASPRAVTDKARPKSRCQTPRDNGLSPAKCLTQQQLATSSSQSSTPRAVRYKNRKKLLDSPRAPPHLQEFSSPLLFEFSNKDLPLYKEYLLQTFQSLKFIKSLGPLSPAVLRRKVVYLPRPQGYESKKTLLFDLDETLVHCSFDLSRTPEITLEVPCSSGATVRAGLHIRPYAREILRETSRCFEVMIFTASHKAYADVVLSHLDPTNEVIHHRLYRENCITVQGALIKDLRILSGRSLKDLVLVDNCVHSFAYQVDNGIPLVSWYSGDSDKELVHLARYLKALATVSDVRTMNRRTFHLHSFYEDYARNSNAKD